MFFWLKTPLGLGSALCCKQQGQMLERFGAIRGGFSVFSLYGRGGLSRPPVDAAGEKEKMAPGG